VLGEIICPIALMTGDLVTADRSVTRLLELSIGHGMTYWARFGRCHEGALLIRRGEAAAGASLLRSALVAFRGSGQAVHALGFAGDLAQGLAASGRLDEAHAVIDDVLARYDRDGRLWCIAEFRRVKGELLLLGSDPGAAEGWFTRAMAIAAGQGALLLELRAAVSLGRLLVRENRAAEVRPLLTPLYDRFTEGFEMSDLRAARALLDGIG
jgi:predicted ATPase